MFFTFLYNVLFLNLCSAFFLVYLQLYIYYTSMYVCVWTELSSFVFLIGHWFWVAKCGSCTLNLYSLFWNCLFPSHLITQSAKSNGYVLSDITTFSLCGQDSPQHTETPVSSSVNWEWHLPGGYARWEAPPVGGLPLWGGRRPGLQGMAPSLGTGPLAPTLLGFSPFCLAASALICAGFGHPF